jgi:hypothetical protein
MAKRRSNEDFQRTRRLASPSLVVQQPPSYYTATTSEKEVSSSVRLLHITIIFHLEEMITLQSTFPPVLGESDERRNK